MKTRYKVPLLLLLVLSLYIVTIESRIQKLTANIEEKFRPKAAAIYRASYLTWLTDEPWDDATWTTIDSIKGRNREIRFDFYLVLIISRDLEGWRALYVYEDIKPEAKDFAYHLKQFCVSPSYSELTSSEKERVACWINIFDKRFFP